MQQCSSFGRQAINNAEPTLQIGNNSAVALFAVPRIVPSKIFEGKALQPKEQDNHYYRHNKETPRFFFSRVGPCPLSD